MPGILPNVQNGAAGAPGTQPAQAGYNAALQNLNQSLNLSNQTTSGEQAQLQQQLQQNQGKVQQGLVNKGLGNTTVAETMQQAPLQTYNLANLNVQNQGAERGMQAYNQLAGAEMQGGNALSQMGQPYAQSAYAQNLNSLGQFAGSNPAGGLSGQPQSMVGTQLAGAAPTSAQINAAAMQQYNNPQGAPGQTTSPGYIGPASGNNVNGGPMDQNAALLQQLMQYQTMNPDQASS